MRFLVTRMDALHSSRDHYHSRKINSSQMWPIVVEANCHENAVKSAYTSSFGFNQPLPMNRDFLVVALHDATVVRFEEKKNYVTKITPY